MDRETNATSRTYLETFDDGPGGWAADLRRPLPVWDGVAYCHGPWSVDANHAPPGAGYLHLLMYLVTREALVEPAIRAYGENRFIAGNYSTDLTNAKLTVRLRGMMDLTGPLCNNAPYEPRPDVGGAQLLLLVQGHVQGPPETTPNFILTGQPFQITKDWSEQTVHLVPDPAQWTCLGARHDTTYVYGYGDIAEVLRDVNIDLLFVLFPLTIVPLGEVSGLHRQWAMIDYKVDMQHLPRGLVMFDTVKIEYPG
ncbi:MAG: hypothetical protein HY318_08625 [Armatimonadetes bacterium]|nr:hypothetical protein [Armatimonadota bacterium]